MAAIKDVARLAGFSPAAVSKYLKNPDSVRPTTRERIEAAIAELNYVPSAAARALRTGKSNVYLLMISHLRNPEFVEEFQALNDEANRRGFSLLVQPARLEENEWNENVDFYGPAVQQVDGVIVMIAKAEGVLEQMQRMSKNLPVVAYGWPYACPGVDTVVKDMEDGVRKLTEHLLEQGHTRVAYVSDHHERMLPTKDKMDGYRSALRAAGLRVDPELFQVTVSSSDGGYRAAEQLMTLPEPPTAIVCGNDVVAVGVLKYAKEHDIPVPERLAITGQDNTYLASMSSPGITSTDAPDEIMAVSAFDMLAERRKDLSQPPHCVVYHTQLIKRESSLHAIAHE
ncbi:MAG: LacI family DNA-binding transcriptional regulator [Oscillospiraceae bacterium]|nr:LacI family DNA-binding transcriptional regulator [Oscillospiraceae bacterium]